MRRPSGILLTCALLALPLCVQPAYAQAPAPPAAPAQPGAAAPAPAAPQKLTFTGDSVLWAFTINPGKEADYEKVLEKLKAALQKLERPDAKQQLASWKVIKNSAAQPDGSALYIHVINPVVKDADYSIINIVNEAFKEYQEQLAFYELYKGALKGALFTVQGPVVVDMAK